MKKTLFLLGLLILLAGSYFFFLHDRGDSSQCKEAINFAVEDTAAIRRINIQHVYEGESRDQILLDRRGPGDWVFNGGYKAVDARVQTLLETLSLIRVRRTLSENSQEKALELLEQNHIQIEVFSEAGIIKSYQVGTQTKDALGTVMCMTGNLPRWCKEQPQVVHIPGQEGYLNSRYTLDFNLWRENLLFNASPSSLQAIELNYKEAESSFRLERQGDSWALAGGEHLLDSTKIARYLGQFTGKIYAESFAEKNFPDALDTLKKVLPTATMELAYLDGSQRRFFLYEREDNLNNFFGWVEGEEDLITVQHFVIDKFLWKKEDFY